MKRSTKAIIGGFCSGAILIYGWRWYYGRRRIRNFHLTNDDLNYSDHSPEELVSATPDRFKFRQHRPTDGTGALRRDPRAFD